jgi:hypothetical protein
MSNLFAILATSLKKGNTSFSLSFLLNFLFLGDPKIIFFALKYFAILNIFVR